MTTTHTRHGMAIGNHTRRVTDALPLEDRTTIIQGRAAIYAEACIATRHTANLATELFELCDDIDRAMGSDWIKAAHIVDQTLGLWPFDEVTYEDLHARMTALLNGMGE